MRNLSVRRVLMGLAAPVLALVVAFVITSLVLLIFGDPVGVEKPSGPHTDASDTRSLKAELSEHLVDQRA